MKSLLVLDTLSDRRDLWSLLHRLHPRKRLQFLVWACEVASRLNCRCPTPVPEMLEYGRQAIRCGRADDRFTNMIYCDLAAIANQYPFDLGKGILVLERFVNTGELPPATQNPTGHPLPNKRNTRVATVAAG